jgi:hypothetical protein
MEYLPARPHAKLEYPFYLIGIVNAIGNCYITCMPAKNYQQYFHHRLSGLLRGLPRIFPAQPHIRKYGNVHPFSGE